MDLSQMAKDLEREEKHVRSEMSAQEAFLGGAQYKDGEAGMAQEAENKAAVTVKEIDELLEQYLKLDEEKEALEAQVTEKNKAMMVISGRVTAYLKELGRDEFDSPLAKCEIDRKMSVNNPQTDEDKKALFAHLRERGIFEKYATVNNASLNALWKKDRAEAEARGEGLTFVMPGVPAPKIFESTKIKPKRKKVKVSNDASA